MKRIITITLVLGIFFFGCNPSDCGKVKKYYDIQGTSLFNYGYKPYYGNYQIISDSVKYPDFALGFGFSMTYYAQSTSHLSFITQAKASDDCMTPGEAGTKEILSELHLITISDLNSNYQAGDTINEIASIIPYSISGMHQEMTLTAFIEQAKSKILTESYIIKLNQKPDSTVSQAFRIVFSLKNGEEYTSESKQIIIF